MIMYTCLGCGFRVPQMDVYLIMVSTGSPSIRPYVPMVSLYTLNPICVYIYIYVYTSPP